MALFNRRNAAAAGPAPNPLLPADRDFNFRTVTRVATYVWIAVGFIFVWLHFSSVHEYLDWRIYSLYFLAVSGVACRYLTGVRHGHERWHRVVFDGLSILFIALGVGLTGGIRSELWLLYFIFVIAETLAASARGFLITDAVSVVSYVVATWPSRPYVVGEYLESLVTRVFFLVLVSSIARTIAYEERRRQEDLAALREALSVSEERRRLARDLHDGVGHVLTRVILSLEVGRRHAAMTNDGKSASDCMEQQTGALRGAMEEMRQLVATLRTDTSAFSLGGTLRAMATQMSSGSFQVDVSAPDTLLPLSPHRQYHLARVVQEALTNCMRHSGAERATVTVDVAAAPLGGMSVVATVQDSGRGFEPNSLAGQRGNGLNGMRERLSPYEGTVAVESAPGLGTRITAIVPADLDE